MANHCVSCGKPIEYNRREHTYTKKDGTIGTMLVPFPAHKCSKKHNGNREGKHRGSGDSTYTPSYYTRLQNGFAIINGNEPQS